MTDFFHVSHNSFGTRGFPWAQSILSGFKDAPACSTCGVMREYPSGDVRIRLAAKLGTRWPDRLGCGAWSLFIVSGRTLEAWGSHGVTSAGRVLIEPPLPRRLVAEDAPDYHWIDGEAHFDAKLDFEASGFVGVEFCPECRRRTDDISATYDRQHSGVWPLTILKWGGRDLFTTDISSSFFFCTRKLVDLATEFSLSNLSFVPVERGIHGESIKYLKRPKRGKSR